MPRPHVEFIQAQMLTWQPLPTEAGRMAVTRKLLSLDAASAASSNLFRYPPGWVLPEPEALACDEELFVLEGKLTINDIEYGLGDYAYLPRGFKRQVMSTSGGAVVVTFLEGPLALIADTGLVGPGLIQCLRSSELPWTSASDSRVAGSAVGLKVLRLNPENSERTWLLNIDVSDRPFEINGVERHPCVEETFLISGDMAMPMGQMVDGAYFWRPPNVPHGPMGTQSGFLGLFRSKEGGPFDTTWSEAEAPIDWQAPYAPTLPSELADVLDRGYDREQRY